ncbi:UDP-N-acetylmuramoylalanyl-D-glutamyl-2,6-diaminopimelate--D-alanyl-D-alanine ligase [Faunimonas sp. B44]|uniref:UDP-N-acetylmuramoylalanyl-D-glutamyl-2, 6-diaminopimelate--D-alanyl-D-alanine ligase n=1 Tax=Faunimonas sp. B44 TaxID=3461493 RepID=UPI004043CBA3
MMTDLWTIDDLVAATAGRLVGPPPTPVSGISIDSRTVAPRDAFFAIRGDRFDGHAFVPQALQAGAALAIVSAGREPKDAAGPLLVVADDPLDALVRLGRAARERFAGQAIAVTGSVGKTGTKEMLRLAFSGLGQTHAPVGSFNNHWGVPLTLARMPQETRFGVFEIGMNHAGEIAPLTRLVRPHVAIVTTVEPVHIEFFPDEAAIADAKAEIFEGLVPGGAAVINRDNRWFERLAMRASEAGARIVAFGEHPEATVRLVAVELAADHSRVRASVGGQPVEYRLGAPGRHLVQNSLAVLGAAHALGADLAAVAAALAGFTAPKGRGERFALTHPDGAFTLIDESYNANPASMRAALALLHQAEPGRGGRRIAVLGDMRELGARSAELHRGLGDAVAASGADRVFLVGPEMRSLWEDLPEARRGAYAESVEAIVPILADAVRPGDVLVVKASLGTRLGLVVDDLKRRFDPGAARGPSLPSAAGQGRC